MAWQLTCWQISAGVGSILGHGFHCQFQWVKLFCVHFYYFSLAIGKVWFLQSASWRELIHFSQKYCIRWYMISNDEKLFLYFLPTCDSLSRVLSLLWVSGHFIPSSFRQRFIPSSFRQRTGKSCSEGHVNVPQLYVDLGINIFEYVFKILELVEVCLISYCTWKCTSNVWSIPRLFNCYFVLLYSMSHFIKIRKWSIER